MIQVDDFYRILVEKGIRMHYENHDNLTDFLMLSKQYPMFILVANIKRALETIHQNEKFMKAIEDDIRAEEQGRRERESGEFASSKGSSLIKNATENNVMRGLEIVHEITTKHSEELMQARVESDKNS